MFLCKLKELELYHSSRAELNHAVCTIQSAPTPPQLITTAARL